ncbi:MAG: phosphonate ABC transporter, permease protein PhnE [Gammaproteobacteria bacterium]|nr:phosphonate ABC transporter, permease protein PhnE [Gammaproteobacteria bacterium]MDX2460992.1 phosphonate ABC transporter, permease protein PhnE [Gammaproteobacteria bacterium]
MSSPAYPSSWRPPKFIPNPYTRYGLLLAAVVYFTWSVGALDVDWHRVDQGMTRAANMFARMVPPDFSRWQLLVRGLLESVQMALAASFIGMILAIPLGVCAAANLVPKPIYLVARGVLVISRTFHEVIIAIFFVKIFGFGPLAGVMTLTIASMSFIGKMLAEDIENMRSGQLEAVRATGANFSKMLLFAVQPQMLPRYVGVSIYRLDANIRHSTVVGIVGAGGIGQTLAASFSRYDYDFSLAILLSIISLVFAGEFFSNWVRARLR